MIRREETRDISQVMTAQQFAARTASIVATPGKKSLRSARRIRPPYATRATPALAPLNIMGTLCLLFAGGDSVRLSQIERSHPPFKLSAARAPPGPSHAGIANPPPTSSSRSRASSRLPDTDVTQRFSAYLPQENSLALHGYLCVRRAIRIFAAISKLEKSPSRRPRQCRFKREANSLTNVSSPFSSS